MLFFQIYNTNYNLISILKDDYINVFTTFNIDFILNLKDCEISLNTFVISAWYLKIKIILYMIFFYLYSFHAIHVIIGMLCMS